jgi:hypothetical protein
MINDNFTLEEIYDIIDSSGNKIGSDVVTYKINKLLDLKNLGVSNTYSVVVKHRIVVDGSDWDPTNSYESKGFQNYPVLLRVDSGICSISSDKHEIVLKRIFPKTINSNVEQSSNVSTGSSTSQSSQTTSGSSNSNVNTFGVDVSGGFFGIEPVGSIGLQYSHSWESTKSSSASNGQGSANNNQATSGNEMSVKDWSAYSSIQNLDGSVAGAVGEVIRWNWGQTYPWNVFEYSQLGSSNDILLPASVVARLLYYGDSNIPSLGVENILLPPSDLSLFGPDFTMAAEWYVTFPPGITTPESLQFFHTISVMQGSHSAAPSSNTSQDTQAVLQTSLSAWMQTKNTQANPIDLSRYALTPLVEGKRSGIAVGFQSNLFDIAPKDATTAFKIRSRGNDLLVTGSGFDDTMSASFPAGYKGTGATLNVSFKILDVSSQYTLNMRHWIGSNSGNIVIKCSVNGSVTDIYISDGQGQGSSNNLSQVDLRNYDLKSANFHDYLNLGWNEIDIQIMPCDASVESEYVIAALSLEE